MKDQIEMTKAEVKHLDSEVTQLIQQFGITNILYSMRRHFQNALDNDAARFPNDKLFEPFIHHVKVLNAAASLTESYSGGREVVR